MDFRSIYEGESREPDIMWLANIGTIQYEDGTLERVAHRDKPRTGRLYKRTGRLYKRRNKYDLRE